MPLSVVMKVILRVPGSADVLDALLVFLVMEAYFSKYGFTRLK